MMRALLNSRTLHLPHYIRIVSGNIDRHALNMQQRFPPTALTADAQHHTRDNPAHNMPGSSSSADPSAAAAL
jgi:hypothetical protein